jgi:hypothetical protein
MTIKPDPSPEEVAKIDAWVCGIRGLARTHRCAHTLNISTAIAMARKGYAPMAINLCQEVGIPRDELVTLHTLIFQ